MNPHDYYLPRLVELRLTSSSSFVILSASSEHWFSWTSISPIPVSNQRGKLSFCGSMR